ncbi:MAG: pitrilysin family protein [Candidatus Omnitrophica bacterium]|nr:pitrilysin family protein [Candidatus Omnitrophota bacterium]
MQTQGLCAFNPHITKQKLKNGMVCLIDERPKTKMFAVNIRINAGSSTEDMFLGTGISHLAEHMAFKATRNYPVGEIEKKIKSFGGTTNASTSYDSTSFYILAPSEHFSEIIEILKEMIFFPIANDKEFEDEKSVILKELIMYNDRPESKISELLFDTAYIAHPYKHPIIGHEENFKLLTYKNLSDYRDKYYVPNNMVLSIVGDIKTQPALDILENVFSEIKTNKYPTTILQNEPEQIINRAASQTDEISVAYIAYGYPSVPLLDKDLFALDILASILGRGDGSRLNKKIVKEKQLARTVSASNYTPKSKGLFVIETIADPENIDTVNELIKNEIETIKTKPVSTDELQKAKALLISDNIFDQEDLVNVAATLTRDEMFTGDFLFSEKYIEKINEVTPDEIADAAKKYLNNKNENYVTILPKNFTQPEQTKPYDFILPNSETTKRTKLKNGLTILAAKNNQTETAVISLAVAAGLRAENEKNNGISQITSQMLLKGTTTRSESEIKEAFEQRGGHIHSLSGKNTILITAQILKKDIPFALEILADIIKNSNFPENEFEKVKQLALYDIKLEDDDIFLTAKKALRKELFIEPPYSMSESGTKDSINSITLDNVKEFFSKYVITGTMSLSICGDIDYAEIFPLIELNFSDIEKKNNEILSEIKVPAVTGSKTVNIPMQRDENIIILGFNGIPFKNPERFSFEILSSILSSMGGRLFHEIRNNLGLSYTQGFFSSPEYDTGSFGFFVATSPQNTQKVINALKKEIQKLIDTGISQKELDDAKTSLITGNRTSLLHNKNVSSSMAINETLEMGYTELFEYENNIKNIKLSDINKIIDKYLTQEYVTLIVGPENKK